MSESTILSAIVRALWIIISLALPVIVLALLFSYRRALHAIRDSSLRQEEHLKHLVGIEKFRADQEAKK
jgi:type III secretory pathway component EscS